jgi:tetratricopeptide (TPR) repeat protein
MAGGWTDCERTLEDIGQDKRVEGKQMAIVKKRRGKGWGEPGRNKCRNGSCMGIWSRPEGLVEGLVLWAMAAWMVGALGEMSPCQTLVEAGASAPELRECYIVQTQQHPSNPAAWLALATDFHTEGEALDAATAYKNVIRLAPDSDLAAKAHLHIGVIFHSQGEFEDALDAYRESVALRPNPDTLLNMAIILFERGDHAEALDSCQRAIAINPQYFAAYAQMAIMQQSSGDIMQAIVTCDIPTSHTLLVRTCFSLLLIRFTSADTLYFC